MISMVDVEDYLRKNQIEFILHEHPPVYTTDDLEKYNTEFKGLACKNLLLKDQKSRRFFLVILPASERADMKNIAEMVNEKKLSFANPDNLKEKLGVEPGAVSPFGLLNDLRNEVKVYISRQVLEAQWLSFHPNCNTASLELSGDMFGKYLNTLDQTVYPF